MAFIAQESKPVSHKKIPPCYCDACLEETKKADVKRVELVAILSRLSQADFVYGQAREVPR